MVMLPLYFKYQKAVQFRTTEMAAGIKADVGLPSLVRIKSEGGGDTLECAAQPLDKLLYLWRT
jgi:hypothetical protein